MRRLSANDILNIWEVGLSQYPLDRAITMLLYACPDMTWEELINLSVIERDARLVDLYEQTFGKTLKGFAECPKCKERLEFALTTSDIKGRKKNDLVVNEYFLDLIEDEIQLKFRFPNICEPIINFTIEPFSGIMFPPERRRWNRYEKNEAYGYTS
jgi:hypothetical protein